jgi:DNA-binding transcriptional LysR family regulator
MIGGQGITLAPPLAAPGITLRPIKESGPFLNLQIHAVWNEDRLEEGTKQFIQVLEQTMKDADTPAREADVESDQVRKITAA